MKRVSALVTNYMSIKLQESFSALRLSFTIDHKTCPGARGLRGKTRGGAGKTGGENFSLRRKNFEFSTFSKKSGGREKNAGGRRKTGRRKARV